MKYLSTLVVAGVLVALVFGFAFNLTSLGPQFPKLDRMAATSPKPEIKLHHKRRKPATLAAMGISQSAASDPAAPPQVDQNPSVPPPSPDESPATPDPNSPPDSQRQESSSDDVPMK